MKETPSTNTVHVDENGLRHYTMNADTIRLTSTGVATDDIPEPFVPAELANGAYANMAYVRVLEDEIIFDFARMIPNTKTPTVTSRVVMNRATAKAFLEMLNHNL